MIDIGGPGHGPRRGQEPQVRHRRHRPLAVQRRPGRDAGQRRRASSDDAPPQARPGGLRPDRPLRRAPSATTSPARPGEELPDRLTLSYRKACDLRYGENPHQKAAFYVGADASEPCIATRQAAGRQGDLLQQLLRRQRRPGTGQGIRRPRRRHHQARQPRRLRGRRRPGRGVPQGLPRRRERGHGRHHRRQPPGDGGAGLGHRRELQAVGQGRRGGRVLRRDRHRPVVRGRGAWRSSAPARAGARTSACWRPGR